MLVFVIGMSADSASELVNSASCVSGCASVTSALDFCNRALHKHGIDNCVQWIKITTRSVAATTDTISDRPCYFKILFIH